MESTGERHRTRQVAGRGTTSGGVTRTERWRTAALVAVIVSAAIGLNLAVLRLTDPVASSAPASVADNGNED